MNEDVFLKLEDGRQFRRGKLILKKKAKAFYEVEGNPNLWIMSCLDVVTQDNAGHIKEEIPGKGLICAQISKVLFSLIEGRSLCQDTYAPIRTHFVGASTTNETEILVQRVEQPIPLELIVRNWAYGSYASRYGIKEGTYLYNGPIYEFTIKDQEMGDPLITIEQIQENGIANILEINHMLEVAKAVNKLMGDFFREIDIELADFKLVFGRAGKIAGDHSALRLIGELSPDVCRLRDMKTRQCFDKDIFRKGLPGGLSDAYKTVLKRMQESDRERGSQRRREQMQSVGVIPK